MARYLKPADFRSGQAFLEASWGEKPYTRFLRDQREGIRDDMLKLEKDFPEKADAIVGTSRLTDVTGTKAKLAMRMPFASRMVLTGAGGLVEVDLYAEIMEIYKRLLAATPVRSGKLRGSYRFAVGGHQSAYAPRDGYSQITIMNVAPYASRIENRVHMWRKVWPYVSRRAKQVPFDAQFLYRTGASEPYGRRGRRVAAPAFTIAKLNALGAKVGKLTRAGFSRRRR